MIGVFQIETSKVEENKERMISSLLANSMLKDRNGSLTIRTYGAHDFELNGSIEYYNVLRLLSLL